MPYAPENLSDPYTGNMAALLEGLEAFFGDSIARVATSMRESITQHQLPIGLTELDEFLDEYFAQVERLIVSPAPSPQDWSLLRTRSQRRKRSIAKSLIHADAENPLKHLQVLPPGDVRPLVRLRLGDFDPWGRDAPAQDAKTVLLYAQGVVLLDPFVAFAPAAAALRDLYVARDPLGGLDGLSRAEWLVRAMEQYASMAPAVRAGLVDSVPFSPSETDRGALGFPTGEIHTRMWEKETGLDRDANKIGRMINDLLAQVGVYARSPGVVNPLARSRTEEALLDYYYKLLVSGTRREVSEISPADRTIARLLSLNLEGIDFARVPDLVAIRQEPIFVEVRSAVSESLEAALQTSDIKAARTAAQESFRDAHVRAQATRRSLRRLFTRKGFEYGVGALVTPHRDSWQLALPLVFGAAEELVDDLHTKKARRAQKAIFLALSRAKD